VPRKVLAKKKEPWEVISFDNPFTMKGTPVSSGNYGMGRNDDLFKLNQFQGMLPDFAVTGNDKGGKWGGKNTTSVRPVTFYKFDGGISVNSGADKVNIRADTLNKGIGTIMGMSPQIRDFTQMDGSVKKGLVQGFNYANPSYTRAEEFAKAKNTGGVGKSKIQQMADSQKKIDAILNARELPTWASEMQTWADEGKISKDDLKVAQDYVIQEQKDAVYEEEDIPEENLSNRVYLTPQTSMKNKSLNKVAQARASMNTDPTIVRANQIQSELGRGLLHMETFRRRRSRWGTRLVGGDPKKIISDYNEKTSLINWAKTVSPDEAKLDPKRTKSVIDHTKTTYTRYYNKGWCHNNRCRGGGWKTYPRYTYKDVLVSENSNQGEKMDMLYDKINASASAKKAKYSTFFKPQEENDDYQYFALTDSDFDQFTSYKNNLIQNVRATNTATYEVKERLAGNYKYDASTKSDDNAPKQNYLKYQKTGEDSFIKPTVQGLKSQISMLDIKSSEIGMDQASNKIATIKADAVYKENQNQNLNNAIKFVEGKSKNLLIDSKSVASRDNLGRIIISDKTTYQKYIKDTPKEYLKQEDTLESSLIPDLESDNKSKSEKYSDMEKEYYRKQRAQAQFGTTRPKRSNIRNARRRK
tara:strand:+ start:2422 stop:4341 length:1920 start_codon:yes stop_codon:yes gene_type:complete